MVAEHHLLLFLGIGRPSTTQSNNIVIVYSIIFHRLMILLLLLIAPGVVGHLEKIIV